MALEHRLGGPPEAFIGLLHAGQELHLALCRFDLLLRGRRLMPDLSQFLLRCLLFFERLLLSRHPLLDFLLL